MYSQILTIIRKIPKIMEQARRQGLDSGDQLTPSL